MNNVHQSTDQPAPKPKRRYGWLIFFVLIVSVIYLMIQRERYAQMGRIAQADVDQLLASDARVTLSAIAGGNPMPSPQFLTLLRNAIQRAQITFDPDAPSACFCAFYLDIDSGTRTAYLCQHHLFLDRKGYRLKWDGTDLYQLEELWLEKPPMNDKAKPQITVPE